MSAKKKAPPQTVKLVVVGDGTTGKSCLLITYATGVFPEEYVPSTCDIFDKAEKFEEADFIIHLWDTSSGEGNDGLRPLSYPGTQVALLVYSCISPVSFLNISEKWHPEMQRFMPTVPLILTATKTDLREDPRIITQLFQHSGATPISFDAGAELAHTLNVFSYRETSSLRSQGLHELFQEAIRASLLFPNPGPEELANRRKGGCVLQ